MAFGLAPAYRLLPIACRTAISRITQDARTASNLTQSCCFVPACGHGFWVW